VVGMTALLVLTLGAPAVGRTGPDGRAPVTVRGPREARTGRPVPALVPIRTDALTRALERGAIDEATYALERARSVFDLAGTRDRYGSVHRVDPRGATMVLRDLAIRLRDLSPAQLREARAILARPTDGALDPFGQGYAVPEATPLCSANGCVHYVTSTSDAPPLADVAPANGVPDYIETTSATFEEVWAAEIVLRGFRAPKSDLSSANNGGNGLIDVYVTQIGDEGLYGYCTTDDPNASDDTYPYWDFSAYCVVDNDYSLAEFPFVTGVQALQVTMAHEFNHASQFAYDAADDAWFMESTATWIEDEVYDDVNDNLQYLAESPMSMPYVPLDSNNVFNVYGDWIFHRFLVESSGDTSIVRRAWENADASAVGPDMYGIQAIAKEVKDSGAKFRWAFADFGMFNDAPTELYEEGADYPIPPYSSRVKISRSNDVDSGFEFLDHLTNRYVWYTSGKGVATWAKLWVYMDGPAYRAGTEGSVVIFYTSGRVKFVPLSINKKGYAEVVVPFGKGKVAEVDLVLTNASTRLLNKECWVDPSYDYSCAGYPRDDGMLFEYGAVLLQ
jgi:hypothetical protein